jgi:hypothetical protein
VSGAHRAQHAGHGGLPGPPAALRAGAPAAIRLRGSAPSWSVWAGALHIS